MGEALRLAFGHFGLVYVKGHAIGPAEVDGLPARLLAVLSNRRDDAARR